MISVGSPIAPEPSPNTLFPAPIEIEFFANACAPVPRASAFSPDATVEDVSAFSPAKPNANDFFPEATAFCPIAAETNSSSLLALVPCPIAIEFSLADKPPNAAREFFPSALEPIPNAVEASPEAMLSWPQAVDSAAVARVALPNAVAFFWFLIR
nr:hypothetical protein [Megasphaera elsdenii]